MQWEGVLLQLTTRTTDFFVVGKMSVDLVGFVIIVGVNYQDPWEDNKKYSSVKTEHMKGFYQPLHSVFRQEIEI